MNILTLKNEVDRVVLIGSSTGGTEALRVILTELPNNGPPILVAQHMPASFTKGFAERLNDICLVTVKEAEHGEPLQLGHVYIAPGDRHLKLGKQAGKYMSLLSEEEPVNRHRPSVEVLFNSGVSCGADRVVGVMLTGMGKDGANAMLGLKRAGAYNICQNQETCVVFGMPREAIVLGAADVVLPLQDIARHVLDYVSKAAGRSVQLS
jgi:two-component system chemotaxis response regulator CheB